jgi:hypothetical protein
VATAKLPPPVLYEIFEANQYQYLKDLKYNVLQENAVVATKQAKYLTCRILYITIQ